MYQEENLKEKITATCQGKNTMPDALGKLIEFEATQENPIQGYFELHWFPDDVLERFIKEPKMRERFAVFGKSADGYPYALWLDDNDVQRVVYFMGSDSAYYYADSLQDFMILLSMGHFEESEEKNPNFRPWIEGTFGITIPESEADLLKDIEKKRKVFDMWMHKNCEGY
jgi:hypothetical protein